MRKYEAQVKAGVALLDKKVPGWVERIDTERLSLWMPCRCVLGQLFPDKERPFNSFWQGTEELGLNYVAQIDNGFNAISRGSFRALTEEWKRQIAKREPS